MIALQALVVPKVLAAAANLAVTGTENSVDLFNNADAGLRLSAEDYHRSYGGMQRSDAEEKALVDAAEQDRIQIAREKGWFYRDLDLTNSHSIASSLMMKVPNTPSTAVAALTSIPKTFITNFGAIFLGAPRPALAVDSDINPYNFQFYGFTEAEIEKYDPIANEKYLTAPVPNDDQGRSRLDVLGDNSTRSPADGDDPNTNDLLHCFVNKFRAPEDLKADPYCKGIGAVTKGDTLGGSNGGNPGDDTIAKIYEDNGLHASVDDDFLRYRIQIFFTTVARGVNCASTDEDCFQATVAPGGDVGNVPGNTAPGAKCQVPAPGSVPNAPVPPDDYSRHSYRGVTLNGRTIAMLELAEQYSKASGGPSHFNLPQGSYNAGGVAASGGTHDGGGAVDISVIGMSATDRKIVVRSLRQAGFAAWNRHVPTFSSEHIHGIAIGDKEMSRNAAFQVINYFDGENGLVGHGADGDADVGRPYPDWAARYCH
jgi:hypothetical protein